MTLDGNPMTDQTALTVRALQDARGGVVVRSPTFLLINMNSYDSDGKILGIVTLDFQGSELPTPDDLATQELIVTGSWYDHEKHGRQFAVEAWALNEEPVATPKPAVRYKTAKRLTSDEIKRLMNIKKD